MARSRGLQVTISGDARQLERAFQRAQTSAKEFGATTDKVHGGVKKRAEEAVAANATLTGSFRGMARAAVTAGAGFAAAYVGISKAKDAIKTTEELAHSTENLHRNFGLTNKVASEWSAVAQTNNIASSSLHMAFTKLSTSLEGVGKGSKPAIQAFKDIGVSQKDLKGLNFQQVLSLVTDRLTHMEGGTKRAAAAQALLGRGAKTLVPLMREGGLGFQQQAKWAEKYGATLDGHAIKSSEELKVASEQLKFAQLGLQIQFTEKIAPALLDVEKAGAKVVAVFRDPNLTSDEKWQKIGHMLSGVVQGIERGVQQALPKIADAVGRAAPHVAATFVNGFMNASVLGKLVLGGWLIKKMGGFGAFAGAGRQAGAAFGSGFAATETATASGGGNTHAARLATIAGQQATGVGTFRSGMPVSQLGEAEASGFAASFSRGMQKVRGQFTRIGKAVIGASLFSGLAESAVSGGNFGAHVQNFTSGATFGLVKNVQQQLNGNTKKVLRKWQQDLGSGKLLPIGGNARTARLFGSNNQFANTVSFRVKGIDFLKTANNALDQIQKTTSRVDKAKLENYAQQIQRVGNDIALMSHGSITNIKTLRTVVHDNMVRIANVMGTQSAAGQEALGQNARAAVDNIRQLMHAGLVSSRAGMKEIRSVWAQTLQGFGFSRADALSITRKGGNVGPGGHPEEGTTGPRHAVGGWIGAPGMAGADNIPIVVGAGEAVLNRHQQAPVETALRAVYGMGLDDLFAQVQRPHYMAKGGKVRYATGGVVPAVASLIRQLDSKGFHHGSTTSGSHAPGSYHYKGEAVDYGDANNDMQRLWSIVFPQRSRFAELFGPSRVHPHPTLMHFGRGFSDPALQAQHENHIHMALTGSLGALGSGSGAVAKLKRILVRGPNSPLKQVVQASLDTARRAANQRLGQLTNLSGFTGGGSNTANMQLGHRMMLAAGFGEGQWPALRSLWQGESGWSNTARNPSSGAFGIPQALPPGKMGAAAAGGNPAAQIRWGLNYIRSRYGSPSAAYSAWQSRSPHWYARGGRVGYTRGGVPHVRSGHVQPHSHPGPRIWPTAQGQLTPAGFELLLEQLDLSDAMSGTPDVGSREALIQGEIAVLTTQFHRTTNRQRQSDIRQKLTQLYSDLHGLQPSADTSGGTDPNQPLINALNAHADALAQNSQALDDARKSNDGVRDYLKSTDHVNALAMSRALADMVSGNLGFRTQQRTRLASSGAAARA